MKMLLSSFLLRWGASVVGLWVAAAVLGADKLYFGGEISTLIVGGLLLALVNMLIKPFIAPFILYWFLFLLIFIRLLRLNPMRSLKIFNVSAVLFLV